MRYLPLIITIIGATLGLGNSLLGIFVRLNFNENCVLAGHAVNSRILIGSVLTPAIWIGIFLFLFGIFLVEKRSLILSNTAE